MKFAKALNDVCPQKALWQISKHLQCCMLDLWYFDLDLYIITQLGEKNTLFYMEVQDVHVGSRVVGRNAIFKEHI